LTHLGLGRATVTHHATETKCKQDKQDKSQERASGDADDLRGGIARRGCGLRQHSGRWGW